MKKDLDDLNRDLMKALKAREELIEKAENLFNAMYELYADETEEPDEFKKKIHGLNEWIPEKYWEFIENKVRFVSKDLAQALEAIVGFSEKEGFLSLKEQTIHFLDWGGKYGMSKAYDQIKKIGE